MSTGKRCSKYRKAKFTMARITIDESQYKALLNILCYFIGKKMSTIIVLMHHCDTYFYFVIIKCEVDFLNEILKINENLHTLECAWLYKVLQFNSTEAMRNEQIYL